MNCYIWCEKLLGFSIMRRYRVLRVYLVSSILLISLYCMLYFSISNRSEKKDVSPKVMRRNAVKIAKIANYQRRIVSEKENKNKLIAEDGYNYMNSARISIEMQNRLNRLKKGCGSDLVKRYNISFKQSKSLFYYIKSPLLTYCKVPKAGSTFWTRQFLELENSHSDVMFNENREVIHAYGNTYLNQFSFSYQEAISIYKKSFNFLVARDPYTRLFSAYMDKLSLCGSNASFQSFLDMVVNTGLGGKFIDRHYSPVYILCHPCEIPYNIVSKKETLSRDSAYIMRLLNISKKISHQLQDGVFQTERKDASLMTMIRMYFRLSRKKKICPTIFAFLKKLWYLFQTQGLIPKFIDFPEKEMQNKSNNITPKQFFNTISNIMTFFPLTLKQKTQQRREMLVSSYRNIKSHTIEQLKRLYSVDFLLFGYEETPPS